MFERVLIYIGDFMRPSKRKLTLFHIHFSPSSFVQYIFARVWILELVPMVLFAFLAQMLWRFGNFSAASLDVIISYIWSTLPVLAISNALPILGAGAVLARFGVAEKPAETLKQLGEILRADSARYFDERGSPFRGQRRFKNAMRSAPSSLLYFKDGEQVFVPRPYWDGAWYFGGQDEVTPPIRAAHELTYCAIQVLHCVRRLRKSNAWLVGGSRGGTQGSTWFLKAFAAKALPNLSTEMPRAVAERVVGLAAASLHYMREEMRAHTEVADFNETRETEFVEIFCEYMTWLGHFHAKSLGSRWISTVHRYSLRRRRNFPKNIVIFIENISKTRESLAVVSSANRPRRATAFRVKEIRRGVILPIIGTASATLLCLALKPLAGWSPHTALNIASIAYASIAASLVANFAFGLWLLSPIPRKPN